MHRKALWLWVAFSPAPLCAEPLVNPEVSLWNLGIAVVTFVAAAITIKNRVNALEDRLSENLKRQGEHEARQNELNAEFQEKIHQNEKKILGQEREVLERLLKQEQLLFARLDERLNRFEDRIDLIVKSLGEKRQRLRTSTNP
ncbi:MAG: hypothetical protein A2600_06310 [Candidatus Lambdaproteobacteria bacterium RIFOXYD1_FULL_56_27]|uniref:Uncharacterized protein n=1 Tax=Candidatus Lambdaproteobacteria bacterium RIFOXYD2_FULL_56_26 TaxID=1817773 RepID=A0A1F6GLC6_9PROT|nr:MAG: hypothetical protein A2557_12890 [Candidatus Lambdaproteobacteria bacterium RIFOXYD2_FULL_56_26]OGH05499.1 MAG: hypothetical protein A2426_03880 [Candidatus Lambdaproteobacteria bacterium RIFOXYC1_FULL_56_13]OGH09790.1 MAG: hypothetical protein A2600_06310 [Candidatus Lambdaproteobacteria bacterium RIFOXYD1_FULL_56_27]